jgi:hypothetical protein
MKRYDWRDHRGPIIFWSQDEPYEILTKDKEGNDVIWEVLPPTCKVVNPDFEIKIEVIDV